MRVLLAALAAALAVALGLAPAGGAAPSPSRWCGAAEASTDRPDALDNAFQVHVIYAYPADGSDRFASLALGISRDIAAIDTWWRAQDSSRAPRWDLAAFAGCDTQYGQLDVSAVKLPSGGAYYASLDLVVPRLSADLAKAPTVFDDPDKKYVVLYDGKMSQAGGNLSVCGLSPSTVRGGGSQAYAVIFLESPCGDGLGGATNTAGTIAHELIHNLGALQRGGPPHACPGDAGHPCDADNDVLSPVGEYGAILTTLQLDIGRDDYYGHSGSWWDTQDSPFLEHVGQTFGRPSGPTNLKASNDGGDVEVDWTPATSPNGAVTYRVWRDGVLLGTTSSSSGFSDKADVGSTHTWDVRAEDPLGFLGPDMPVTYTLSASAAATTSEPATAPARTAPAPAGPAQVAGLRAARTATGILLRWSAPRSARPIASYTVRRNGAPYVVLRRGTSLPVPKAKAAGTWTVAATDDAGRTGRPSAPLKVA